MAQRIHFGESVLHAVHPPDRPQQTAYKPLGLWYSREDEDDNWSQWCRAESFADIDSMVRTELQLDLSRMLLLKTVDDVLEFSRTFGVNRYPTIRDIDWPRVSGLWGGIEISPYQHPLRFKCDVSWYYTWDVASGCIWDPRAIVQVGCVGDP